MGARADDTKSLKSAVVDWIIPSGGCLNPPLSRNVKTDRGFFHETTGALLCPATLDWNDESYALRPLDELTPLMMVICSTRMGLKSGEIAVTGDVWPTFLYRDHKVSDENPWDGLFEGELLVQVRIFSLPRSLSPHQKHLPSISVPLRMTLTTRI
jgi:hypothetical protein